MPRKYIEEYTTPVHSSMCDSNNNIYVGHRDDCNKCLNYRAFGGYIIEKTYIIEYLPNLLANENE